MCKNMYGRLSITEGKLKQVKKIITFKLFFNFFEFIKNIFKMGKKPLNFFKFNKKKSNYQLFRKLVKPKYAE